MPESERWSRCSKAIWCWLLAAMACCVVLETAQGRVLITEFVASNDDSLLDEDGDAPDWIEIHNASDALVNLAGWSLTDDEDEPRKWVFPSVVLGAHDYLVVFASDKNRTNPASNLHTDFQLSSDGEFLALMMPDGVTISHGFSPEYPKQREDISYGLAGDLTTALFFDPPTPGSPNGAGFSGFVADTKFDPDRGFYEEPFDVTITCETAGAVIRYTTNGTPPSPTYGNTYTGPVRISGTTPLQAMAYDPSGTLRETDNDCHTYLFLEQVLYQQPPEGYPDVFGNGINADYEMDPEIVEHPLYKDRLFGDLKAIPTVSIVMDKDALFDPSTGIYMNPDGRGDAWERPCSAEFIYPVSGTTNAFRGHQGDSVQVNCGIRIQGAVARSTNKTGKHPFRLCFREQYGPGRFKYPIYGEGTCDSINTLVCRAGFNYTWVNTEGEIQRRKAQYVRCDFARDLQREVTGLAADGFYVHFYLNGIYWGMYDIVERADGAWASWHIGGEPEDWDALNAGIATDGDTAAWLELLGILESGAEFDSNYQAAQGLLDLKAYTEYMILALYRGNGDWPMKNWKAVRRRNPAGKYLPQSWDSEYSLMNLHDNMTGVGTENQLTRNIARPYHLLKENGEYRMYFADAVHRLCYNGGVLTPENVAAMWSNRAAEVEDAISCESARWGDYARDNAWRLDPDTYIPMPDPHWYAERDRMLNDYFPYRTDVVLQQFRDIGLYPQTEAPEYSVNGVRRHGGELTETDDITIEGYGGTTYYTLDGSDPRVPGVKVDPIEHDTTILIDEDAEKKALVPSVANGGDLLDDSWLTDPGFDDSSWHSGILGIGYDRNIEYEPYFDVNVGPEMDGIQTTCYVRTLFSLDNISLSSIDAMKLGIRYDDGFVAFLNGVQIASANAPNPLAWNSEAIAGHGDGEAKMFLEYDVSVFIGDLRPGETNLLAIHGLNRGLTSSDFLICPTLEISTIIDNGTGVNKPPAVSDTAIEYTGPIQVTENTLIKARVLGDGEWSALSEAEFLVTQAAASNLLAVSELHFHPAEPTATELAVNSSFEGSDFEFIELVNISGDGINLAGVSVVDGVEFTFPTGGSYVLDAGERLVVVRDAHAFESRYGAGIRVAGEYVGKLANGGERIAVVAADGSPILAFEYDDARGWDPAVDGAGHSLIPTATALLMEASGSLDYGRNWRRSTYIHGSPGEADPNPPATVVLNELMAHTDFNDPMYPEYDSNDWIEIYNPTASPVALDGDLYLSDDINNPAKWSIGEATTVPAGGWITFDEIHDFHQPISEGFGLSKDGETLLLSYLPGTAGDRVVDCVRFKGQDSLLSLGRSPDGGVYWRSTNPSRGISNGEPIGSLVIEEFMFHPEERPFEQTTEEYIRISNPTDSTIHLWNGELTGGEWRLAGGVDFVFPPGTSIWAGGSALLAAFDPDDSVALSAFRAAYGLSSVDIPVFGPYIGALSNRGERMALERPQSSDDPMLPGGVSWIIVDEVIYFDRAPWDDGADGTGLAFRRTSMSSAGNDPAEWEASVPDPASAGAQPVGMWRLY